MRVPHFALIVVFMMAGAIAAFSGEDAELRRYLSLLKAAHIGNDYEAVKKLAPEIGALQKDAGENNTEAQINTKLGKIALRGEFNFAKGHLVSHGFRSGELSHSEAHDFLLRCITILENLYGPGERRIVLPTESDGPRDSIGMSFNWHRNQALLGLDFHYRRDFATVSWGAQAE